LFALYNTRDQTKNHNYEYDGYTLTYEQKNNLDDHLRSDIDRLCDCFSRGRSDESSASFRDLDPAPDSTRHYSADRDSHCRNLNAESINA
jgi:hypothetical protein